MKARNLVCLMMLFGSFNLFQKANACNSNSVYIGRINPYFATSPRYDYLYANPPRPSIEMHGRFIKASANVRYMHSPSRLKGVRHAARINANNRYAYGY